MVDDERKPAYLALQSSAENDWKLFDIRLSDMEDLLSARLETKTEAIGTQIRKNDPNKKGWVEKFPTEFDASVGVTVRLSNVMPYNGTLNQNLLTELLEEGKKLLWTVEPKIRSRELDLELLRIWGRLCSVIGAIELVEKNGSHLVGGRSGVEGAKEGIDQQKRWFAHYFLRLGKISREHANHRMTIFLNEVYHEKRKSADLPLLKWYEKFFNRKKLKISSQSNSLTGAFLKDLSETQMRKLVTLDNSDLPDLDLTFPHP